MSMRTVVLRKSVGPFSAGTVVGHYSKENGMVITRDLQGHNAPLADTVKLRSRADLVPVNNREKRRADSGKRQLWRMLNG